MTNYLAENGHRVDIIWQLSVHDSVQFLGVTNHNGGSGLPFIFILHAPVESTGWGSGDYSNQDWEGSIFDANRIKNFNWGASVDPRHD